MCNSDKSTRRKKKIHFHFTDQNSPYKFEYLKDLNDRCGFKYVKHRCSPIFNIHLIQVIDIFFGFKKNIIEFFYYINSHRIK